MSVGKEQPDLPEAHVYALKHIEQFKAPIDVVQGIVLNHAKYSLQQIVMRIDDLHAVVEKDTILKNAHIDAAIPGLISDICFHAGLAATILFDDSERDKHSDNESARSYEYRMERVRFVAKACADAGIEALTLRDTKVRNRLAHVDQHIAKRRTQGAENWIVDSAVVDRSTFLEITSPRVSQAEFVRCYVSSEDVVIHLGHELHLKALHLDCSKLLACLFGPNSIPNDYVPRREAKKTPHTNTQNLLQGPWPVCGYQAELYPFPSSVKF